METGGNEKTQVEPQRLGTRSRVRPAKQGAEVEDGSSGCESGLSGRIIYEEGYAGETALLIRVPEKGLGGHNPGESRRDSEVWGQEEEQERKGEEKKAAPQARRLEQAAALGLEL